ncbi:fucosyltransferase 2-like [Actinidia eriantha]|uniref:fucosyltransferase 2-like n=1 Tax=Actinidia eriantha TaxID=165200 RepID=UPI002582F694|nr:fucosyltransferase 2-like [Actinidia eriantha]
MAEGTRFAEIDDAIRSLNEFRKESETQIRDLNNSISRFIQAVDQRLEDRGESVRRSEEPVENTSHNSNHQYRSMKIEVPRFDGTDVSGWIFKIEQFFQFYNTPVGQRILISSFNLDGPALSWFKWMHSNGFIESWKGFLKALNHRFGPSMYEDYRGALSKLQQTSSVTDYQTKFEDLSTKFKSFSQNSSCCYGIMLRNGDINRSKELFPWFLYLHLGHDYGDHDKMFFCDHDQALLAKVPWLVMKTDNYFVPSLFLIPLFERELGNLFPVKGTIFHQLGWYLFHLTNKVWGLITRYYQTYLAKSDETLGIQIEVFDDGPKPLPHVIDQSLYLRKQITSGSQEARIYYFSRQNSENKSRFGNCLELWIQREFDKRVLGAPVCDRGSDWIFQQSHEESWKNEDKHNFKLWAEIYLLSLTDSLVTRSWSTMGYVAQGLAGLNSLIMYKPEDQVQKNRVGGACQWSLAYLLLPFMIAIGRRGGDQFFSNPMLGVVTTLAGE